MRRKVKIETLMKELKAVFLEKNEFGNQVESRLADCKNWRFQFQDLNAASGLIVF